MQPPLPTAPRSRYGSLGHLLDQSDLSTSLGLPPIPTSEPPTALSSETNVIQADEAKEAKIVLPSVPLQPEELPPASEPHPVKQPVVQESPKPMPNPVIQTESSLPKSVPKKERKSMKAESKVSKTTPKAAVQKPTPVKVAPARASSPKPSPPPPPPPKPSSPEVIAPKAELPKHPQPTPSPITQAVPQVMIAALSPNLPSGSPLQAQKRPVPKKQPTQPSPEKVTKASKPPVDYQVLLLSLADEYLNAAHRHGTRTALATSQKEVEEYYKLVSTGLGCLEAVLKVRKSYQNCFKRKL